jgi:hypothetical protein
MPGILQEQIAVMSPLVTARFARHTVAASLNASALTVIDTNAASGALNVTGEVMPFAGAIVGVGAALSVTASAGSLTLDVTINGTVTGFQLVITTSASGSAIKEYGQPGFRFNAGDTIGVKITTSGSWNGTTADLLATVYVIFDQAIF